MFSPPIYVLIPEYSLNILEIWEGGKEGRKQLCVQVYEPCETRNDAIRINFIRQEQDEVFFPVSYLSATTKLTSS